MSNGSNPLSKVTKVELSADGKAALVTVSIYGYEVGSPVLVSGHVIQANGAYATFHDVQTVPAVDNDQNADLQVNAASITDEEFAGEDPITVVAHVSNSWISALDPDSGELPFGVKAHWTVKNAYSALHLSTKASGSDQQSQQAQEQPPAGMLRHGTWWYRARKLKPEAVMEGRFGQLFRDLRAARFDHSDLERLAEAMTAPPEEPELETDPGGKSTRDPEENRAIPAAYTYLGQFIDHDLTFDPTSQLREPLTPARIRLLEDFRTPRFDLDNLYGRGPDDQPYMYCTDGIRMLLGEPLPGNPFDPGARQLPRGPTGRALIGDPRDDENRIVAQLHAVFLRFHNRVADLLDVKNATFQDVRQQVRWHYQWVVVNDFLRTILEERTYNSVFPNPWRPVRTIPGLRKGLRLMPVEFSVAAYRFGHSMVRSNYQLNPTIQHPIFSTDTADTADLGGMRPIPDGWAIDWQFFIDLEHGATPAPGGPPTDPIARKPQLSYKIDTSLVNPLGHLPARIAADPSNLALRNLERGAAFGLPSGQDVAWILGVPAIADEDLAIGKAATDTPRKPITKVAPGFAGKAPLWTYILSEAQVTSWSNGRKTDPSLAENDIPIKLGPVGGRLIAEVFAALLVSDPTSYLHAQPVFAPIPDFTHRGKFGLAELINIALGRAP